ncbi:MAG: helix-turn-helix domain-containing protein [Saprospiraceae bacterium]
MRQYEQQWLDQLNTLIDKQLHLPDFKKANLVEQMNMSPSQFYRQVVKLTELSPVHYIRLKRLTKAKELLEVGVYGTVAEVALAVGYRHVNYFSKQYENQFGRRPSDYLR